MKRATIVQGVGAWAASALLFLTTGCGGGQGLAGTAQSALPGGSNAGSNVTGLEASAQAFLARSGFVGLASVSDRAIGNQRFLVFHSRADLVAQDTNGRDDIYLRDLRTGALSLVSVASDGTLGDGPSTQASISADGRFVAFRSAATNLVAGDSNSTEDIFLRDLIEKTTARVSLSDGGQQSNGASLTPAVSNGGQFVVFASQASNLVGSDNNGLQDVFVRDVVNATTTLISSNVARTDSANGSSWDPAITPDGSFIAFASEALNVVGGLNGQRHIIRIERANLANRDLVSQSASAAQADGPCYEPSLSADGNRVAFFTLASNLATTTDGNGLFDVYLRDLDQNTTQCLSLNQGSLPGNGHSGFPSLSSDGSVVAFGSLASDLVASDSNGVFDVFARDGAVTTRVSVDSSGSEGNVDSDLPAISGDGRLVAFRSAATNLHPADTTGDDDIFLRDRSKPLTSLCSPMCRFPGGFGGMIGLGDRAAARAYHTSRALKSVAAGDLNGDGFTDLVAVTQEGSTSGDIAVLFRTDVGEYSTPSNLGLGRVPQSIAVGDLDGDGDLDLVTGNTNGTASVLFNNGSGAFSAPVDISSVIMGPEASAQSIALGDMDGDGDLDLVVAQISNVGVLLNDGTGAFSAAQTHGALSGVNSLVVADLDGDSDLDIAVASSAFGGLTVMLNDGSANFTSTGSPVLGVASIAAADLNGDGDVDLALGHDGGVSTLLNDGAGAFPSTNLISFGVGVNVTGLQLGDLDGDGDADLAAADREHRVRILLNDGSAAFSAPTLWGPGYNRARPPFSFSILVLADLNEDGVLDVAAANALDRSILTLFNDGNGELSGPQNVSVSLFLDHAPGPLAAGDLDGDGILDLVTGKSASGGFTTLINQGLGNFLAQFSNLTSADFLATEDVDGDGDFDLVLSGALAVNDGSGNFATPVAIPGSGFPFAHVLHDLNGDGFQDLINSATQGTTLTVQLNNGAGGFLAASSFSVGTSPQYAGVGDWNGDGHPDLAVPNLGSNNISLLLNDGSGGFGAATTIAVGSFPRSLAAADLNGDGHLDLAVANSNRFGNNSNLSGSASGDLTLLFNDGSGGFTSGGTLAAGPAPENVVASDIDGDGDVDLVVSNHLGATVSLLLNAGAGSFEPAIHFVAGSTPSGLTLADLDGDGDLDVSLTDVFLRNVNLLFNATCP